MRQITAALVGALALISGSGALAQTYRDTGGTVVPGVIPLPFSYTPLPPGQHNLAAASATALAVPAGARYATVCASTAAVRYTTDGATTPTASVGMPLAAGACMALSGPSVLANFRAFSSSGTLDVEYFQ
jgi:hypothetical protein